MLCEYRSDDSESLDVMKARFEEIFDSVRDEKTEVLVRRVGERPCAKGLDREREETHAAALSELISGVTGIYPERKSSSTDCNIPMSLGIPAVCIGVYNGADTHKRSEWVERASLVSGLEIAIKVISLL